MLLIENIKGQQAAMKVFDVAITETINSLDSIAFNYVVNNRDSQDFNRNANALMTPGSIMTEPKTGKKFRLLTVNPASLGDYQQYAVTGISLGKNLHNYYVPTKLTSKTVSTRSSTSKSSTGSTTTTSKTTKTAKTTVTTKTTTAVNTKAGTTTVTITKTTKNNMTGKTTTKKTVHRHTNRKVIVKTVKHSKHSHHAKKKKKSTSKKPTTTTTTTIKKATDKTNNSSDSSGSKSSSSTVNKRSLTACLHFILSGTPFKYKITGKFGSFDFGGDFGKGYADSLLAKLAKDFDFEYYFDNFTIRIVKKIGKKNAFLYVENANVAKISSQEDFTDITTEIEGYGKKDSNGNYSVILGYKSPVKELWGRIDATPIFTNLTDIKQIEAKCKKALHDYPSVQYSVSYVDFKHNLQGFHNDPTPGNWGFLRSRFGIDLKVRIQSRTYYPQETKNTGSITFGNTIFDPVVYQHKIQSTYQSDYEDLLEKSQQSNAITDESLIDKLNELGSDLL